MGRTGYATLIKPGIDRNMINYSNPAAFYLVSYERKKHIRTLQTGSVESWHKYFGGLYQHE